MRRSSTVREAREALQRPRGSLLERAAEWLFVRPGDERAALDKGARHVATGLALATVGLGLYATAEIVDHGAWRLRMLGAVAGFGIMAVGIFAGSRLARATMLFFAFGFAFLLGELPGQVRRWHLGYGGLPEWYAFTRAAATVLFIAGSLLANFTPAALAHHAERRARRKARRGVKSLADWRAGAPRTGTDAAR